MRCDNSGWLKIGDALSNEVFDITDREIDELIHLSEEDDAWALRVKEEVEYYDKHPGNFMVDLFRTENTGGTTVDYPYGTMLTYPSRRHLFRGETQQYKNSLPSLNRAIQKRDLSSRDAELYRAVANMRIRQFRKFIWQFDIVPYWEAKLCDVNYTALAQHYGFETSLLDITSDARVALFFATCKYVWKTDSYRPLTQEDIDSEPTKDADPHFGVIFHSPDWLTDYMNGEGALSFFIRNQNLLEKDKMTLQCPMGSAVLDGTSFQIGYQPFYRCQYQSGYIFPMRESAPLQQNSNFEKLRFRQSVELSKRIYDMMDGGNKIFPQEGIREAMPTIREIQASTTFSRNDLMEAYEFDEVDKNLFPTTHELEAALSDFSVDGQKIIIQDAEVPYPIPRYMRRSINKQYNKVDLGKMIGQFHTTDEQRRRREERCLQIYGKLI